MASSPRKKPAPPPPMMGGGDRSQNIQVFVRCRPLNKAEKEARSYSVVDCPNSREVTVKEKQMSSITKTFQFDKVFGIKSKQLDVYRAVVEPLIGQVMQGYNCTVFAYGQTGTGKTFTMEGGDGRDDPTMTWENDPTSGIIPRALAQLFDELRVQQEAEFSVRVSFLELYNEEIFDLLSAADDITRLRLYEDSARKGSVIIQGLEEVQVHSKREVYQILEKGSAKRQTAATLMNAHSSRSHTVFTVTVHMKESSVEGEEVLRIGKLNLVDLAGSENVGRSGAMDKRAREAGNINQSLLTLGRVITCLVERAPHIPYRESKLTRLLQDSLGGRTKTSIIATISPAGINLEETLSTLDYAHRAKNITNKPEVNQKLSKKAVLKEYTEEIERLRKDLMASREKNGVFLANENYQDMINQIEIQSQEITEKIGSIKALKDEMDKKEEMYEEVSAELDAKSAELESTNSKLAETEHNLDCTKVVLQKTASEREEQKHLVEKHVETEGTLKDQAKKLLETSEVSTKDLKLVHDKLDRLKTVEEMNAEAKGEFSETFQNSVQEIVQNLQAYGSGHEVDCSNLKEQLKLQLEARAEHLNSLGETLNQLVNDQVKSIGELNCMREEMKNTETEYLTNQSEEVQAAAEESTSKVRDFKKLEIEPILKKMADSLLEQAEELRHLETSVTLDVVNLVKTVNTFSVEVVENVTSLKNSVEGYSKTNETRVKNLMTKNQDIQKSEDKFKSLLDALMTSYSEHSKLVNDNTKVIDQSSADDLTAAKNLVDQSKEIREKVSDNRTKTFAKIDEENVRISEYVKVSTKKCTDLNAALGEEKSAFEMTVNRHVDAHKAAWNDFVSDTKTKVETQSKLISDKTTEFKEVVDKNKTDINIVGESVKEFIEETKTTDSTGVSSMMDSVSEVSTNAKELVANVKSRITQEKETVSSFVTEVLQEDQPTGMTPARTERNFPRYLAATSPHERILNRFRAQAEHASVAARLPLDDSDDGDSMISGSTNTGSLSRNNSTGDVRKVSPEVLFRQNSNESRKTPSTSRPGSQNGSRANSRQNSGCDLKSKFGSTSDLGSEMGEQENQDPNFRKPPQRTKSKRELKRPDMRTRGPLNSAN
eukprot:GFUD01022268.1.p1 GENE.GFUD01022268.1~~GFUD01022268.1.p1  ORF type:complete len:1112 (-),score=327.91 GFUD01022268.1:215-3550(-)